MSFITGKVNLIDVSSFTKQCHYAIFKEAACCLFLVAADRAEMWRRKRGHSERAQRRRRLVIAA